MCLFCVDLMQFSQFYLMNYRMALETDMMIHSHPVKVAVNDAHEIDSIFDDISYFKVSCMKWLFSLQFVYLLGTRVFCLPIQNIFAQLKIQPRKVCGRLTESVHVELLTDNELISFAAAQRRATRFRKRMRNDVAR